MMIQNIKYYYYETQVQIQFVRITLKRNMYDMVHSVSG